MPESRTHVALLLMLVQQNQWQVKCPHGSRTQIKVSYVTDIASCRLLSYSISDIISRTVYCPSRGLNYYHQEQPKCSLPLAKGKRFLFHSSVEGLEKRASTLSKTLLLVEDTDQPVLKLISRL